VDEGRGSRILPSAEKEGSLQPCSVDGMVGLRLMSDAGRSGGILGNGGGFSGVVKVNCALGGASKSGFLRLGCAAEDQDSKGRRVGVEGGNGVELRGEGLCKLRRE